MSGSRGTNDLSCNETLTPDEDRPNMPGIPGNIQPNRRFTATNPHSQGAFRVNYPTSGNTPPQKTYTAIARPVASRSYSVANTTTPRAVIGSSAYQAGPSGNSAGSGQRGFVAPSVPSSRIRHPSLHDDAPHITFTTNVPATSVVRNSSRFIPPTPPPNPFVNSLRLTQAPPAPPSTGSKTAQGLLNVVQSMPRHSSSPSLNQFGSNLFGRSFSPSAAHRSSTNLLGTTSLHGATNSLLGQVPTSPAIQRVQTSTPQGFLQGSSSGFVHPSPTLMGVHHNTVNTPSPRPSILRKPSTPGSAAKRKLPFMADSYAAGSSASTSGTSASPSISSVRSIIQNTNEASTSVAKALGSVGTSNNGTEGESPRKRQRKQQFDNSQYEPMMMAVGVEPVKTPIWELPRDHPLAQEYFRNMHLPTEKKKRGRPRADASGKTSTPADQFMVQTGVRRVFVPMDQLPNQALSQIAQQQNQLLNPGMPAADAVAAAIQAAGMQNLQTQAVTSRYLGGTPLQNVNPKQTVKEVLMKAAAEQIRMQSQQKKQEGTTPLPPTGPPIAAVPTPKEPKLCPTPAPVRPPSSTIFAIPDIPTTLKTPRQLAAEKKKAEAEAIKAAKAAEIAEKAAAKSKARQAAAAGGSGHFAHLSSAPSTSRAAAAKATTKAAAPKTPASKTKKEPVKKPAEVKPAPKPVIKKTPAQLKAEEEAAKKREALRQKKKEKRLAARKKKKEEWRALKKKIVEKEKKKIRLKALYKKPANFATWTIAQKTSFIVQLLAQRYLRSIKEKALFQKEAQIQALGLTEKFFPDRYRKVQDNVDKMTSVSKFMKEFQRPRMKLWKRPAELTDRQNHFKNIELLEKAYEEKEKATRVKNLAGWARNKLRRRCQRKATELVKQTTKYLRKYYKEHNIAYKPRTKNRYLQRWLQKTLMHRVMDDTKRDFPVLKNFREKDKKRARLRQLERRKRLRLAKHRRHNKRAEEKRQKEFQAERQKKLKAARHVGVTGEIEGVHYVIVSSKVTKMVDGKKKTVRITKKVRIKQEIDYPKGVIVLPKKTVKKKKIKKTKQKVKATKKTAKKRKTKLIKKVELNFPLVLMPLKKVFYTKEEFDKHVEENKMKYGGGPVREIQLPEDPVLSIARSLSVAQTVEVVAEEMPQSEQMSKVAALQPASPVAQKVSVEEAHQNAKLLRRTIPSKATSQGSLLGQQQKPLLKANAVAKSSSGASLIGVKHGPPDQPPQLPAAKAATPLEIKVKSILAQAKRVNEPSACGMLPGPSSSHENMTVLESREVAAKALVESSASTQHTDLAAKKLIKKKKKKKTKSKDEAATDLSQSKIKPADPDVTLKVKTPQKKDKDACQIIEVEHKPTLKERKAFLRSAVAKYNEKCETLRANPTQLHPRKPHLSRPIKYQNTYNYLWQKKMLRTAKAYQKQLYGYKVKGKLRWRPKKLVNSKSSSKHAVKHGISKQKRLAKAKKKQQSKRRQKSVPSRKMSWHFASKKALIQEYKKKALEELKPKKHTKEDIFRLHPHLDPELLRCIVPDYEILFNAEMPVKKTKMRIWDPVAKEQKKRKQVLTEKVYPLKQESIVEQTVDEIVSLISFTLDKDEKEKDKFKERAMLRREYKTPVLSLSTKEYRRLLLAQRAKQRQQTYSFKDAFADALTKVKKAEPVVELKRPDLPVDCGSEAAEVVNAYHKTLGWWEAVCGSKKKRVESTLTRKQKRERKRRLRMKRLAQRVKQARKQKKAAGAKKKKIEISTVPGEAAKPSKPWAAAVIIKKLAKMMPYRKVLYIRKLRKLIMERKKVLLKKTLRKRRRRLRKQVQKLRKKNKKKLNRLAPFRKKQTRKEILDKMIKDFVEKSEAEKRERRAAAEAAAAAAKEETASLAESEKNQGKKKGRPPKKKKNQAKAPPTPTPPPAPEREIKVEEPEKLNYRQFLRPLDREYTFADVFADLEKANQERLQKAKGQSNETVTVDKKEEQAADIPKKKKDDQPEQPSAKKKKEEQSGEATIKKKKEEQARKEEAAGKKKKGEDSKKAPVPPAKEPVIKKETPEEEAASTRKVKVTKGKPVPPPKKSAPSPKAQLPPKPVLMPPPPLRAPEGRIPKKKPPGYIPEELKKEPEVPKKEPEPVKEVAPKETAVIRKEKANLKRKADKQVAVVAVKKTKGGKIVAPKKVKQEEPEPTPEPVFAVPALPPEKLGKPEVNAVSQQTAKPVAKTEAQPAQSKQLKKKKKWKPDRLVGTPSSRAAMWRYSRRGFIPMTVKDYNKQKKEARKQKRLESIRRKEYRKQVRRALAARRRRMDRRTKLRLLAVSDDPIVRKRLMKAFQTKMRLEAKLRRTLRHRRNEKIRKRKQIRAMKLKKCEDIAKKQGVNINVVKRRMFRVRRQPFYQPTKRDIAIMRLEQLKRQFDEQVEMDRRLLVFFVDLLKTYDPAAYNKLQLDIARDYEPGDTPIMVKRKKWERIRVTLMRPAAINLPPPKRPVLFESNDCVIVNPSKTTVNQVMRYQSPFWKGPVTWWNRANSRLDKKGNLMADRSDDWKPLDMTPRVVYKEDMVEWNTEKKLRECEANMELYWNQYCEEEGIHPDDDPPQLPPSLQSDPPVYKVSRRTLMFKQDKSDVVWVGGCDRPKLNLVDEEGGIMDDPEAKEYYYHAREMLATSSKNVHEQAIINFHILQKLIDDIVPKTPEQIAVMRAEAAARRRRVVTPPPPPQPVKSTKGKAKASKSKKKGAVKQPKSKPGKKAKKQQQAAAKAKKEAKKEPPKPRAPKHPRAPRTPVLTESTFERQMRRAIQESLRCMPSTSKAKH